MNAKAAHAPIAVPVDEDHVRMMSYALSREGQEKIAKAQKGIDEGKGILADDAYFKTLKERRAKARAAR